LGKSLGEELIAVRNVSPSVNVFYFTWKFERGPLFVRFNCYQIRGEWNIVWIQTSDVIENIAPGDKWFADPKRE
jgi:hypothetical protein